MSALKVMSRPAERRSLPAFCVSLSPLLRCEAVIQPVEVAAVDLAAVGKAEQAMRIEPDAIRFFSRSVVLVGMSEGALAFQVIRGRCRLGQSGYHDASPETTLPDRDTTWPEYSCNMTVVALMIPAFKIPLSNRRFNEMVTCDLYKSGQSSLTFIGINVPGVQRCEK